MSTGEARRWVSGVYVYPWYTWLRCARFLAGWDSCPAVVYSALQIGRTAVKAVRPEGGTLHCGQKVVVPNRHDTQPGAFLPRSTWK